MNPLKIFAFASSLISSLCLHSQGEANQWRFGNDVGLIFGSTTPSVITNSPMNALYSSASMADAAGNLLFYTDGITIWNRTNNVMANGSNLSGNTGNGAQMVLAVKKPGSSAIYYVVTALWNNLLSGGLYYSVVDMSLASGNGSVTVKNVALAIGNPNITTGKLTATKHCNGTDIWIVGRDWYSNWTGTTTGSVNVNNSFRSFLVTAAGINTTAVVSTPVTYTYANNYMLSGDWGSMKLSPTGKKLGVGTYNYLGLGLSENINSFELFDFDNSTGVISNPLALITNTSISNTDYSWGVEFSPDGSKLYGSMLFSGSGNNGGLYQWDLCAGSSTAIVASKYTVLAGIATYNYFGGLQLAPDGKIYMGHYSNIFEDLDAINNPNALGSACNYSIGAVSLIPTAACNLPNFMSSYLLPHPAPTPFTYGAGPLYGCQTASFSTVYVPGVTVLGCATAGYSLASLQWDFGDPVSGAANTSTLNNPQHVYNSFGTYTTQLMLRYSCGGGTDTLRQVVNINTPCVSVASISITCASLGQATVSAMGAGPFSYTWMPSGQTGSIGTALYPGTYTITIHNISNNSTATTTTQFIPLIPYTGTVAFSNSISCNGAATGTAMVNLNGGSGLQSYLWTDGVHSYTLPIENFLSAGMWSVTVTDNLTACVFNTVFAITQPPALTLNVSSSSTACAGGSITLTGTASGGSPSYNYSWTSGPAANTKTVSQPAGGIYIYTLTGTDANNCVVSNTVGAVFINNPSLSVPNTSICPLQTGTLNVSGAGSYTWSSGTGMSSGSSFTGAPSSTTSYTVTGAAQGCTSMATASIILKPAPVPILTSNSPVCSGQPLQLSGSGGTGFLWTGPAGFNSSTQNPLMTASVTNSGVYQATVTAANTCTALATTSVVVNSLPVISVAGNSFLCTGASVTQTANGANTYSWSTGNLTSTVSLSPLFTSTYTVTGTDANGCINSAIETITVNALPVITISGNSVVCAGTSITQTASGASSYSWNTGDLTSTVSLFPLFTSTYTVMGTDGNGCTNLAGKTITVNSLPVISIAGNSSLCTGASVTQTASGANTYSWSTGNLSSTVSLSPLFTSTYAVMGTDSNGCTNSAIETITVNALPVITISGNSVVCTGISITQTASGASSYSWSTGDLTSTISLSPLSTSTYIVMGTDGNGCTSVTDETITVNPSPVLAASLSNSVLCAGETGTIHAAGANTWLWNTGATSMDLQVSPTVTTTYSLTGTGANGCSSSTMITQVVNDCEGIVTQQQEGTSLGISPNPNNGVFDLALPGAVNGLTVEVYNSLGLMIKSEALNSERVRLDLSQVANGIYFLFVNTGKIRYTAKVIKE